MSPQTPNLDLPLMQPAQAQKHIVHNQALQNLDAVVQLSVLERRASPPPLANDGERFLIGTPSAVATDAWAGHDNAIAEWRDGVWHFHDPQNGWIAWQSDREELLVYSNMMWADLLSDPASQASVFGINATADTGTRLSVISDACRLSAETDSHRLYINKAAASDTASIVWQTGASGRAEIGLTGTNHLSIKVSADGAQWTQALTVDPLTGQVDIPQGATRGGDPLLSEADTPHLLYLKGLLGASDDLNTFTQTGMWHQDSNAQAYSGTNYPIGLAGLLTVVAVGDMVYQTYRVYADTSGYADATYTRGWYNQIWTSWKELASV